jgi:tRNA dimethylallyltransferase
MRVYTGADFERDASLAILDISHRDKLPIITGGTFFYLDVLRGKIQPAPVEPNEDFRNSLAHFKDDELFAQLQEKDPTRAKNIDPFNRRRLVRALEVIEALGSVPQQAPKESPCDWLILGLSVPIESLHHNIHTRLRERLDNGMLDEVKRLHKEGVTWERFDDLGLEYRYIAKHLQGHFSFEEMLVELEIKIRQYAKRQATWLKNDTDIEWFDASDKQTIFKRVDAFLHGKKG